MKILLILICSFFSFFADAQNSNKKNDLLFSITAGVGVGSSPGYEKNAAGISSLIDFAVHKNIYQVTLRYGGTAELQFLGVSVPGLSLSSADLMFGKLFYKNKTNFSVNTGAGVVTNVVRGMYLYSDPGLFSTSYYEKIKLNTIGLPISLKFTQQLRKHFGVSLEAYANINKIKTFYGINLCTTFGKYQF